MTSLLFCQNNSLVGESNCQKDIFVTHILFDLCLLKHFSPVANFGYQSLGFRAKLVTNQTYFIYSFIFLMIFYALSF